MRVLYTLRARADLEEIFDISKGDNPRQFNPWRQPSSGR
jgi:hypothetical protein